LHTAVGVQRNSTISGESSRAWDLHKAARERQREGHEVIVLTIGEHDFPGPEAAVEASVAALKAGRHHYTPSGGDPALREAVARELQLTMERYKASAPSGASREGDSATSSNRPSPQGRSGEPPPSGGI